MKLNENLKKIILERWEYILGGYLLGYLSSLKITGIPSLVYLIPLKFLPIMFAIFMATGMYHAIQTGEYLNSIIKSIKPIILIFVIFIILMVIHKNLKVNYGVDISPIVGL